MFSGISGKMLRTNLYLKCVKKGALVLCEWQFSENANCV